jgi:outer membrane lipoprotein-sorting protein
MNNKDDNQAKDILEQAISAMRQMPIPPGPSDQVLQTVLDEAGGDESLTVPKTIKQRIITMKNITRIAASFIIVAGIIGLITVFTSGSGSIIWAQVAQQVEQVRTFSYRMIMKQEITSDAPPMSPHQNIPEMEAHIIFSAEQGMKMEMTGDGKVLNQMYIIPGEKTAFMIMPEMKSYMRMELTDDLMENTQKQNNDPRYMFKEIMGCEYVELERQVINGIEVEGIETTDPKYAGGMFEDILIRIWVDVDYGWPVMMEMDVTMASPTGSGQMDMHMVMDDFQWNIVVDPQEFLFDIPEDYTAMGDVKMPEMNAESAIDGLRMLAQITGSYPEMINPTSMMSELMNGIKTLEKQVKEIEKEVIAASEGLPPEQVRERLRSALREALPDCIPQNLIERGIDEALEKIQGKPDQPENDKTGPENDMPLNPQEMQEVMQMAMPIQGLVMFYMSLVQQDKDPHYYGATVTPDDADKILLAWKIDDSQYEVIYGDLSTGTVPRDQLPPLEEPLEEPLN